MYECGFSYSFKAVEVKFWSFLVSVGVIFFVVWGVYLNVFIFIKSLLSYNQSHENQKETIQSQWTCVLSSTHKPISLLISITFLFVLANKLKLTLRPAQLRALYHRSLCVV